MSPLLSCNSVLAVLRADESRCDWTGAESKTHNEEHCC